jgi:hypothetical protein
MKIKRGYNGGTYFVFANEYEADKWYWLFGKVLRMRTACFGNYFNAYSWSN